MFDYFTLTVPGTGRLQTGFRSHMNSMSRIFRYSRVCKAKMSWLAVYLPLCVCIAFLSGAKRERMNGMIGSSVLLDPKVKADPSKQEIIWTFIARHRSPLTILHHIPDYLKWAEPSEQFRSHLQFIPANGSLMINGLKAGDQGDYSFMAADRTLKIIQLFLFRPLSEDLIVINTIFTGSTIQLTCKVDEDCLEYQWWKNGVQVCCNKQMRDDNRTLLIPNDAWHESATYMCVARNPVSSIRKVYILTRPDKFKEEVGLLGSSVLLDPEFKVDPSKSEIVWSFIDRSILHHVPGHSLVELSDQFEFHLHLILLMVL